MLTATRDDVALYANKADIKILSRRKYVSDLEITIVNKNCHHVASCYSFRLKSLLNSDAPIQYFP